MQIFKSQDIKRAQDEDQTVMNESNRITNEQHDHFGFVKKKGADLNTLKNNV